MPIALSSLMVGDWMSLLLNVGGTGPDPTLGETAAGVDAAVLEEVATKDTKEELGSGAQEGSLVASPDDIATVGGIEAEASDCAVLACFLAAALVCHPHEHGLLADGAKNVS